MSVGPRAMRQPFLFHHIKKEKYDRCEGDGGGRPVAADLEMVATVAASEGRLQPHSGEKERR